jgi:hypothetical protein
MLIGKRKQSKGKILYSPFLPFNIRKDLAQGKFLAIFLTNHIRKALNLDSEKSLKFNFLENSLILKSGYLSEFLIINP